MKSLFICIMLLSQVVLAKQKIFVIQGFFVPSAAPEWEQFVDHLKEATVDEEKFEINTLHNNNWKQACQQIKTEFENDSEEKNRLVLIGHSFGASAAREIADCITPIKIDLFVSIDAVKKPGYADPSEVVSNVFKAVTYYQTQDLFIKGSRQLKRLDEAGLKVENVKVDVQFSLSPHNDILKTLARDKRILGLLEDLE